MARILRMRRRRVADRLPAYLSAWDDFRRSAERVGWHAWLFHGQDGVWLEFVEGRARDRMGMEAEGGETTAAADASLSRCGEVMEESWWDEVPPAQDQAPGRATGG